MGEIIITIHKEVTKDEAKTLAKAAKDAFKNAENVRIEAHYHESVGD